MKKFLPLLILALLIGLVFTLTLLAAERVEINTASLEELDKIIGIGPVLGQRIIEARPFSSIDDLLRVKGIGQKTLQKIKDQGLAYVETKTQQPIPETNLPESNSRTAEGHPLAIPLPRAEIKETPGIEVKPLEPCPEGIIFNEILPSPEGPDEENEWIEIFNQNEKEIDLARLIIKDLEGATTSYIFPDNSKIVPKGYLVLKRGTTKITLNNTGDKLEILCQDKIIDSVSYEKAKTNQSYNRIGWEWKWSTILTPGKENIISSPKLSNKNIRKNQEKLSEDEPRLIENNNFQEKETANIGEKVENLYPLVIAVILAGFSGAIIFILKKVLKNSTNKF